MEEKKKPVKRFDSRIKYLVVAKGYNSVLDFSEREKVSYPQLRKLMHGTAITVDVQFLITVCDKLDCQIEDLIILNKGEVG